jgi:type IV pilus assembly protein PilE
MRGFSLLELMLVLAVLAVLGAVAYPTYAGYAVKARRIEAQVALVETLQHEESYFAQHHAYLAFSAEAPDTQAGRFKWWLGAAAQQSAYEIDAYACPGHELTACVEVRARPGTSRVNASFSDPDCGTLTFNSAGVQAASGPAERCWP